LKDLLRQSGRDAAAVGDEEAGFEVCRKEGIASLVLGSYIKAGEIFATDVKVLDVASKQILKTASSKGDGVSSVLKTQIDEISRTISRGLGPVSAKLETTRPKIAELTTSSMEAYNYFLRGRDDYEKFYYADARKFLEKAVALDPTFAVAYLYLGKVAAELFDTKAQTEAYEMAKKYSTKATEKERLYIEAGYASVIELNPEKRLRILLELTNKYSQEKQFHYDLGRFYEGRAKYREAIAEHEKALTLDPDFGPALNQTGYDYSAIGELEKALQYFKRYAAANPGEANPIDSMAELYFRLGKFDEAKAKYQEALEIRPDFYQSCGGLAYIFALEEKYTEAGRWLEELVARAPTPSEKMEGNWLKPYVDYFLGRTDESLSEYSAMKEQAERVGAGFQAAITDWITGYLQSERSEFALARKAFQEYTDYFLKQYPTQQTYMNALSSFIFGWVDLKEGRLDSAKARLKEMEPLLPKLRSEDEESMTLLYRLLESELLLAENLPEKAIEAGEKIVALKFPNMTTPQLTFYNIPFLKDVLARAYWKKGDLDKAIAEYARLTTIDPKNQIRYLIHPLYHYRLGRVYEEKGEKAKAATEYRKFLEYWKDADANHPELADAKKRLESLMPPPS